MRVEVHDEAALEIVSATARYEQAQSGLGDRFIGAVDRGLARLASDDRFVVAPLERLPEGPVHRVFLTRFPFRIVFIDQEARRYVLAVAHHRRAAGYWKARLEPR